MRYEILKTPGLRDCAHINALLKQLSENPPELSRQELTQRILRKDLTLVVARDDHKNIIGMATLLSLETLMGKRGRIEDVVVDSAFQRRGIAGGLVRTLIDFAHMDGAQFIELTSRPDRLAARKLYEKLCFLPKDTLVYRLDLSLKNSRPS